MGHVFISYSRRDMEVVEDFVKLLHERNIETWIDIYKILPGDDWRQASAVGLASADALILMWSHHSSESGFVEAEWRTAYDFGVPIIPVAVYNEVPPLPTEIENLYYAQWGDESKRLNTLEQITNKLPGTSKLGDSQLPSEPISKGYVFISYAKQNLDFVESLRKFMEDHGYAYWDYKKTRRQYNLPFHLELESAVSGAELVLCVISPDWKKSNWSAKEYLFADYIGKPIFVLKVVDPGPTLLIIDKTPIDFEADETMGFEQLDQALRLDGLA